MRYTRRRALTVIGCATAAPLLPKGASASTSDERMAQRTALLRSLIADRHQARMLGREYRMQCPAEARMPALMQRLSCDLDLDQAVTSREHLLAALESCVRAQFASGETVRVRGWIIARTEARLCALCE